jgi:hypothetical protein
MDTDISNKLELPCHDIDPARNAWAADRATMLRNYDDILLTNRSNRPMIRHNPTTSQG